MTHRHIIIAGSGRSGTTWIQDVLAEANSLRTIFEPLHPMGVPRARHLAHRYVGAEEDNPDLRRFFDDLFAGRLTGLWPDYRIRPDRFNLVTHGLREFFQNTRKLVRHRRKYRDHRSRDSVVVKFIRANLMLSWIARHYDVPILFVVRHPCAVIASRMKIGGGDWDARKALERYLVDRRLIDLIRERYGVDITRTDLAQEELLAMVWCIENMLPISWSTVYGFEVVSYEGLMTAPETEWRRVVNGLELLHVPDEKLLGAPSQQVAPDMRNKEVGISNSAKWKSELSDRQLDRIDKVLKEFGCTSYSIDNEFFMPA